VKAGQGEGGVIMIGAIAGDVIGSVHEATATKTKDFPLFTPDSCFTDDTVLTAAVADVLINDGNYVRTFHKYYDAYPDAGYGQQFRTWAALRKKKPYNSWGNGSAMRVSPIGHAFNKLDEVLSEAERSASVTHNHPEGIRGAKAVAAAVFLARQGTQKLAIQQYIETAFGYRLDQPLKSIRRTFLFDVSCEGTVPHAIRSFLESSDFEDAVRNAISLGGDADTLACIAGSIAEAYYGGVPIDIEIETLKRLDEPLRQVVRSFRNRFCVKT
jgi:ADP-ribosylglycohydrolase